MKIERFKVLLYLKKSSPNKGDKAAIMGRITLNRSMTANADQSVHPNRFKLCSFADLKCAGILRGQKHEPFLLF
ncbi:MAG: hypothetical protein ACK5JD_01610 [Mangrovibacterium sp.]